MDEGRIRTAAILGEEAMQRLAQARCAVFGLGGVGGSAAEALARSGVGELALFDPDTVAESNLNRQAFATYSTVGMPKTRAAAIRIGEVNRATRVIEMPVFYMPENADRYPLDGYDCVLDAVDTVTAKIELAIRCRAAGVPLIMCLGTGNKLDPTKLEIADISETSVCPLARVMRRELKKRGIDHQTVVYSREVPLTPVGLSEEASGRIPPGSTAFVPPAAGLAMASWAVHTILRK